MSNDKQLFDKHDQNPDPLTGEPGAHPVGTGIGAAGAGATGAAIGAAVGGPVGAVVGAAIGAVAGGLGGKAVAESINPTVEDDYWRNQYASRPYYEQGRTFEEYQPAYRAGYEGYGRYSESGRTYDEVEPELQREYENSHSRAGLEWEKAKHATQDAWNRLEHKLTGETTPGNR